MNKITARLALTAGVATRETREVLSRGIVLMNVEECLCVREFS